MHALLPTYCNVEYVQIGDCKEGLGFRLNMQILTSRGNHNPNDNTGGNQDYNIKVSLKEQHASEHIGRIEGRETFLPNGTVDTMEFI